MNKILVIGAKGMAGHVVFLYLQQTKMYEVWGMGRGTNSEKNWIDLDVSDENALEEVIKNHRFSHIINCIGILNKDAEDNPYKAIWYNSYFPHLLEKWGHNLGFKLTHISTDCVFSGKGKGGYTEKSFKDGIGYYAQSKALGEVVNERDLTIRTSIIGPELKSNGIGLFHWFMQQTPGSTLKGFSNAYWSGVTTLVLAKAIHESIQQRITGLYQLTNSTRISKFDLITLFNVIFRNGSMHIESDGSYRIDKSLINTNSDFKFKVANYTDMITEMHEWMNKHSNLYHSYK